MHHPWCVGYRLDDIGERTFNLRKELDEQLGQMQTSTTQLQQRADHAEARTTTRDSTKRGPAECREAIKYI